MSIVAPESWKKIDPKNYKKLGIANNEDVICIGSYLSNEETEPTLINFYDYSKNDAKFLDELHKYYDEIEEMNELIDGNPDDEDYESTAIVRSLYHGYINDSKNIIYVNFNKVLVPKGYKYILQLFNKGSNGMYCLEMNLHDVNEHDVLSNIKKSKNAADAIRVLNDLAGK